MFVRASLPDLKNTVGGASRGVSMVELVKADCKIGIVVSGEYGMVGGMFSRIPTAPTALHRDRGITQVFFFLHDGRHQCVYFPCI